MADAVEQAHVSCWNEPADVCTIEATVVTGFETVAKEECVEKLNCPARVERGRIFFDISLERVPEALKLRSVDNVYVLMTEIRSFEFPDEKEQVKEKLKKLVYEIDWATGLKVWKKIMAYETRTLQELFQCEVPDDGSEKGDQNLDIPKFRVTCNRSGKNHCFTSMEAAAEFGGAVNDQFHWKVDMKHHDIEVVLTINENKLYVGIALTKESLHYRNLENFGPTSMRATIAYNLLRLCAIAPQDIVCDPMCGGGSIPIEGALNWPNSFHICGDNHPLAWSRTLQNVQAVNRKLSNEVNSFNIKVDIFQWDACVLPLRNNSVDVFVTDLPFGKRMGSKFDNRKLYPRLLEEMARVCKNKTGRAVLLTQDKKTMSQTIGRFGRFWRQTRVLGVNIGGLSACVYLLNRTTNVPFKFQSNNTLTNNTV